MSTHTVSKSPKAVLPQDGKTWFGYPFWNFVNEIVVVTHFRTFEVEGLENIPADGPFLLIANHSKRWDGPVVQYVLNRRANYMVSPNEMKGIQGAAVMSVGAFPAHPRLNPVGYALKQLQAGEPVVVFPEGNVFYDGEVHPFKTGVAKIALSAANDGYEVPVIPMYIDYGNEPSAKILIGKPVNLSEFVSEGAAKEVQLALSQHLHDEVVELRNRNSGPVASKTVRAPLKCSA